MPDLPRPTTLERAFQLAQSGECRSTLEIQKRLRAEDYPDAYTQLSGRSVRLQLRKIWTDAAKRCALAEPAASGLS